MTDDAKLGLVAGVLAVVAVAVFGFPRGPAAAPQPPAAVTGSPAVPPALPPAAGLVPAK
jgi:hypothetical protein